MAFVLAWPGFGMPEARTFLDGTAIRAAAERSHHPLATATAHGSPETGVPVPPILRLVRRAVRLTRTISASINTSVQSGTVVTLMSGR